MRRRLAVLIFALLAVLGAGISVPQPAAADGPIGNGVQVICQTGAGSILDAVESVTGRGPSGADLCDAVGDTVAKKVKDEWNKVWESVLGDVITSAADVVKWIIRKVLTVALLGPSLDLEATGLFGRDATLAGMMTWLGLVIAAAGAMWQLGKMAITGQSKHLGRAALGWVENTILSAVGVAMVALLLVVGDAMTAGLVDATFEDDGKAYETIVAVMVPATIKNPVTMLCIVSVLLLVGFIQLVLVFLRQSAIPILCLLLPVAGGGRVGGDATRQWAPKLITAICVVIAYKPILAIIICVGFAEFGHAKTLAEWLRGCATLILAILAPGPLTALFAPFGAAVGGGMASGGIGGALSAAAGYLGKQGGDSGGSGDGPPSAVKHAQYVERERSRGSQNGPQGGQGETGRDAQAQAARNEANARVPGQARAGEGTAVPGTGAGTAGAGGVGGQTAGTSGTAGAAGGTGAAGGAAASGAAAGGAGIAIQVLDGVNNTVQGASGQIGNGGSSQ
ncbi:hypothetical protein [Streptomyces prasinus]|uniref:hypothetical protein n=1 Tax=Streptomyces prasinus TaxID=67345 RepID=UPI0006EBCEAF|nr:hypothetical protein [Streptomyces prasinus]